MLICYEGNIYSVKNHKIFVSSVHENINLVELIFDMCEQLISSTEEYKLFTFQTHVNTFQKISIIHTLYLVNNRTTCAQLISRSVYTTCARVYLIQFGYIAKIYYLLNKYHYPINLEETTLFQAGSLQTY